MSRAATLYRDGGTAAAPAGSLSAELPREGFYKMRLVRDGHPVGIELRHGAPLDPETGEEMDRSHRWQVFLNGVYDDDFTRYWPVCANEPIAREEHEHLMALHAWGQQHDPHGAQANPRRRVDLLTCAIPF